MAHVLPNEAPDESKYADNAYAPRNSKTRQRKFDFLPKPDPDINDNSLGQPFPQNELEKKSTSSHHSKNTPLWLETLRLGIMPTVLGVISIYVTSAINNQQIKNANDIAEQHLASTKQIATAE